MDWWLRKIAEKCNQQLNGDEKDFILIWLGLRILIEKTAIFLLAFLLAFISGYWAASIIIFSSFFLLRIQAGGMEFRTLFQKLVATTILWLLCIWMGTFFISSWIFGLIMIIISITIYLFAPVTMLKQPVYDLEDRRKRKNRALLTVAGISFLAVISVNKTMAVYLLFPALAEAISLWIVIGRYLFFGVEERGKENQL